MERPATSPAIDIPEDWERSAALILQHRWRVILVLGAMDRGKSTYCRFVSRQLLVAGATVAFVDADVGQKDLGPPAALTLGYLDAAHPAAPLSPAAWYFVGATTPARHLLPVVLGTQRLVASARAAYVVINTTGFVHGVGRILKSYKIDAVRPDVIIALERGRELAALLTAYRHYRILRLPPSPRATEKSPQQRREARERAFGSYFAAGHDVVLPWRQLIIQGCVLLTGTRVAHDTFPYAARTSEGLIAVAEDGPISRPGYTILPVGFERHLLCGVAGRREHGLGLAILTGLDFARETVALWTPVPVERIKILQFGDLYVHPDGRELGHDVPRGL
jgi:polynucleotide 5'-hydroxyl-kinase GRC3/NOL9